VRCSTNSFVTPQYELQLIAVGMLLAKPTEEDSEEGKREFIKALCEAKQLLGFE
jgi:hypothetical protein